MIIRQARLELEQCRTKPLGRVVVVMEMNLDFAQAGFAERRQAIQVLAPVLFGGKEKRVARWPSVGIGKSRCQTRQPLDPGVNPRALDGEAGIAMPRLEVVRDTDQNVDRPILGRWLLSPGP